METLILCGCVLILLVLLVITEARRRTSAIEAGLSDVKEKMTASKLAKLEAEHAALHRSSEDNLTELRKLLLDRDGLLPGQPRGGGGSS